MTTKEVILPVAGVSENDILAKLEANAAPSRAVFVENVAVAVKATENNKFIEFTGLVKPEELKELKFFPDSREGGIPTKEDYETALSESNQTVLRVSWTRDIPVFLATYADAPVRVGSDQVWTAKGFSARLFTPKGTTKKLIAVHLVRVGAIAAGTTEEGVLVKAEDVVNAVVSAKNKKETTPEAPVKR